MLLEETLLMSYLFLGFPAMMTAFDILREADSNRSHYKTDKEKIGCSGKNAVWNYSKLFMIRTLKNFIAKLKECIRK